MTKKWLFHPVYVLAPPSTGPSARQKVPAWTVLVEQNTRRNGNSGEAGGKVVNIARCHTSAQAASQTSTNAPTAPDTFYP